MFRLCTMKRSKSPFGIGRAILNNVTGGYTQGGSTITQQYAKNAFLTQDRTISRKLKELVLAVKLDTSVPKDQILEDYLNTIYFGRGAYGIQTASTQYFNSDVSRLDLGQAAALAAIIRSPGGYNPDTKAKDREEAAKMLAISERTMYRKLQEWKKEGEKKE